MIYYGQELYHHGIEGQKWGQRRWQYEDGSLTPEGRIHYGYGEAREKLANARREYKKSKVYIQKRDKKYGVFGRMTKEGKASIKDYKEKKEAYNSSREEFKKAKEEYKNSEEYKQKRDKVIKTSLKVGAIAAGVALASYGGYLLYNKFGKLPKEMRNVNNLIEIGKVNTKNIQNFGKADIFNTRNKSYYTRYLGNDLKSHEAFAWAGKGSYNFENHFADTQSTFKNIFEYKKALKNVNSEVFRDMLYNDRDLYRLYISKQD